MSSDTFQDYFDRKLDERDHLSISSMDWGADPGSTHASYVQTFSEEEQS